MNFYHLLVFGAGSIELPIFSDATDDEYETFWSINMK